MKEIGFTDTTLRDGNQCLWAMRMTTGMMLPMAEALDRAGFESIDLASSAQFDVMVRFLRENPWERVRLMRARISRTPLRSYIRSKSLISFDILPDDIVELWVERLLANGFRVIATFDGLGDVSNMAVSLNVAKRLGATTIGALAFCESPLHTDALYVAQTRELISRIGVDAIMIKDSCGLLTPDRVRTLVPALKSVAGKRRLELHSHCMTGLAPLVYLEAAKLGIDQLHTSIAPLANGAAQPATQTIARNLRNMGYAVGLDDRCVSEVGEQLRNVAEQEGMPVGVPMEYDAFHYQHQVPGGMLPNLRLQLREAGLLHRFDDVLLECARVREDLAWPIMITPFAQLVATQAVFNVVNGERYRVVPDEVKKYALGYYGRLLGPVNLEALDRIVENGSERIALKPSTPAPAVPALRKLYPHASDDERLLRYMFAGSQVDEMMKTGAARTQYTPERPLVRLLRELRKRNKYHYVHIENNDFLLQLSGRAYKALDDENSAGSA